MGATEQKAQPVDAEPQPDRSHVVPLLNRIDQMRLDLTTVANWLFAYWPSGGEVPIPGADVARHYNDVDQLRAAREALSLLGDAVVERRGPYGTATVQIGDVRVAVQASRYVWDLAFPEVVRTARAVQASKAAR